MATVYKWNFYEFDCDPLVGNMVNVVRAIHWRYSAIEGNATVDIAGCTGLALPTTEDGFVAYENITEAWCQNIVEGDADKLAIVRADLDAQLATLLVPASVPMAPPFGE